MAKQEKKQQSQTTGPGETEYFKETIATLEKTTVSFGTAINDRQWNPKLPPWAGNMASQFRHLGDKFHGSQSSALPETSQEPLSLDEFLFGLSELVKEYPNFKVHIHSIYSIVDDKGDAIQVHMPGDACGLPEGVVRPVLTTHEWRLVGEEWLCVWTKTLPRVDMGF